jgi:DNA-binding response OmpR family regulator
MSILIVEDEERVADFIERGLKSEGLTVTVARNGRDGLRLGRERSFEVIVLDLILPDLRGQEVCRELRAAGVHTPILMLTAMDSLEDKVEGLNLGADDYLTKPFAFEELVARIEALRRRRLRFVERPKRLSVGDLVFDREQMTVSRGGIAIELTAKEMAILEVLMRAPGKVFSRARILSSVWGYDSDPLTNVVDVYIARLRKKVDAGGAPELITTVRGYGYKLGGPSSGSDSAAGEEDIAADA